MEKDLLTITDFAAMLKVSQMSVRRYWYEGHIPPPIKIGHRLRWQRSDIDKWLAAGCPHTEKKESLSHAN